MSSKQKASARIDSGRTEVKSKFEAEFRRFSLSRAGRLTFEEFYHMIEKLHNLGKIAFLVTYTDKEGDLLPINNDDNFAKALETAKPLLRLCIQRKGQSVWELNGYGTAQRKKNPIISKLISESRPQRPGLQISAPEDFRRVSAIIDVDIVPETHRRVKLMKNGSDKPLGFYIRDGTSVRLHANGVEKVPGIFISRLVPGGLAESTGLLAVNDEVLEVNGIEVVGKTLDQVTDMMVANSSNLIITVKPVNQRNNIAPKRGGSGRQSQKSTASLQSTQSGQSLDSDEIREYEEHDEVKDYTNTAVSEEKVNISANLSVRSKDSAKASNGSNAGSRSGSIAEDNKLEDSGRSSPMVTL